MDQKFNTSFIPKKFLAEDVQGGSSTKYVKQRTLVGPGYMIAVLIFVLAVGASVALFVYTRILDSSLQKATSTITEQLAEMQNESMQEFIELERQMKNAKILLDKHLATSEILHKLEATTLNDVRYSSLEFTGGLTTPRVGLMGETKLLQDVALQIRELETDRHFVEPALLELERDDKTGLLEFGIDSGILPELILFNDAIRENRHGKSSVVAPKITTPPPAPPQPIEEQTPAQ